MPLAMPLASNTCIGCKWAGSDAVCRECKTAERIGNVLADVYKPQPPQKRGAPNKTEAEYGMRLKAMYPGADIRYEPVTFRLANGHKYTPDWGVFIDYGIHRIIFVEVKARGENGFRQHSYGRAKMAFDQAKIDYPWFTWRWAEKHKGQWED